MTRTARCCCGELSVEASGDPAFILACHCLECQRRTGSVFGVGAYFPRSQVEIGSSGKIYVRDGQDGRKLRIHFCSHCGTSVFWELDMAPQIYGIAIGTFGDPNFAQPTISVWEENRHSWVAYAHEPHRLQRQPSPAEARALISV